MPRTLHRLARLALVAMLAGCGQPDQPVTRTVPKAAATPRATNPAPAAPAMPASPALVAQAGAIGKPTFPKAPSGWVEQDPGAMRKGSWKVTAGGGVAELAVTAFPGDVGGRMANINRWRGQLGLAPLADLASVERCDIAPGLVAVDLRDAKDTDRMITVIAPAGGATWFFKLRGTVAAVESERGAFAAFVREVAGTPSRVDGTPGGGGSR